MECCKGSVNNAHFLEQLVHDFSMWQISWIFFDYFQLSVLLNSHLKFIYCETSRCFEKEVLVYIWQSSPSSSFCEGKKRSSNWKELCKILKFHKSYKETSVLEFIFLITIHASKLKLCKKILFEGCFPVDFAKYLGIPTL